MHVRQGSRGERKVLLPDQRETARLETLDDARRVAHLCAAHRHPCELIVQDAYRRVLQHEFIDGAGELRTGFVRRTAPRVAMVGVPRCVIRRV